MPVDLAKAIASGALARDVVAWQSSRLRFEWRVGGADREPLRLPALSPEQSVDLGTLGTADLGERRVVGHGTVSGKDSVYLGATWFLRDSHRFRAHGLPAGPLPFGHPLWVLFAATVGGTDVRDCGSGQLEGEQVRRFSFAIAGSALRKEAERLDIYTADTSPKRRRDYVPAEAWSNAEASVVRLACATRPLARRPLLASREHKEPWYVTDLWEPGTAVDELPAELRATPPDADFSELQVPRLG
jgi:hypothetical protein